jgi:glycosyltransferase involved in cell wall biosynthesis
VITFHSMLSAYRPLYRLLKATMGWSSWPVQWTAVSRVAAAQLRQVVGSQVVVLPNGIDVADWRLGRVARSPDRVLVVGVMRLASRKRPLPLLRMLRSARRRLSAVSTVDLQAVVVGGGGQRGTLERYLRAYRMQDWVQLSGRLPRAEIRSLYEHADLFIAPAVLESFGIAALEARCAGLPVLARTAGGIGEFVAHDQHGLLADSDTALVRDLVRLAADPAERERLATASRQAPPALGWLEVLDLTDAAYASAEALSGRPRAAMFHAR